MGKLYKLWSGDYSDEGYRDGFKDGKEGKPKNKLRFFFTSNPVNWFWAFDNALESYSKYYDIGYADGERVKHNVYYPKSKDEGNMASFRKRPLLDSYKRHLKMIENAKRDILSLKGYLHAIEDSYKKQIERAGSEGFMKEYVESLEERYRRFKSKVELLKELIDRHIKEFEKQERDIERNMRKARR